MADTQRFLTLTEVAEVLNTSSAQVYAMVRRGELPAIKIGGRGQWRVERDKLEEYIAEAYKATEKYVETHPSSTPSSPSSTYRSGSADVGCGAVPRALRRRGVA